MFFPFSVVNHLVLLVVGDVISELRHFFSRFSRALNLLNCVTRPLHFRISVLVFVVLENIIVCIYVFLVRLIRVQSNCYLS